MSLSSSQILIIEIYCTDPAKPLPALAVCTVWRKFTVGQTEKVAVAENLKVVSEQTSYYGSIKSYNPNKGFGFICSEAFPDKDVFEFVAELPGGFGPEGSPCKFSISMNAKGPAAKKVMLLGAADSQIRQMKWMLGYGYRGFGGFGHYARRECALGYGIQVGQDMVGQDLHDSMLHISVQIEMP